MECRPRIIGIDYGTKRVGIAVSDPLRMFAQPLDTCHPREALNRVAAVIADPGVASIVVGWPLTLSGDDSTAWSMVEPFVRRLERRFPGVEIIKWDERFSSEDAKRALFDAGVSRKARRSRERVNAAAAAVILQDYLDQLNEEH